MRSIKIYREVLIDKRKDKLEGFNWLKKYKKMITIKTRKVKCFNWPT